MIGYLVCYKPHPEGLVKEKDIFTIKKIKVHSTSECRFAIDPYIKRGYKKTTVKYQYCDTYKESKKVLSKYLRNVIKENKAMIIQLEKNNIQFQKKIRSLR